MFFIIRPEEGAVQSFNRGSPSGRRSVGEIGLRRSATSWHLGPPRMAGLRSGERSEAGTRRRVDPRFSVAPLRTACSTRRHQTPPPWRREAGAPR